MRKVLWIVAIVALVSAPVRAEGLSAELDFYSFDIKHIISFTPRAGCRRGQHLADNPVCERCGA